MPTVDSQLHLQMLESHRPVGRLRRAIRAAHRELMTSDIYGLQWGDPEREGPFGPLRFVLNRYVVPHCQPEHTALEIGPGGGRWTRYLLGFRTLYLVDVYQELLDEVRKNYDRPHVRFVRNEGSDFPGVPDGSIDFLFSFGTFVHLEADVIDQYLRNMQRILRPNCNVVLQYADKTKIMARLNDGFAWMTPAEMRRMVRRRGYRILEEDLTSLGHSSLIRFTVDG